MDTLSSDFEELCAFFNARRVRAVVVGGHALAFHGHPRFTKDLDVFVDATADNAARIVEALNDFGFGTVGLTADDFTTPGRFGVQPVWYLGRAEFIRNKRAAGRPQDVADIAALE